MLKNVIFIFLITFFSSFILLIDDYQILNQVYFYIIVIYIGLSISYTKKVQLIHIWNVAFVFIILSEIILLTSIDNNTESVIKYLLIANNILNIGYLSNLKKNISIKSPPNFKVRNTKIITPLLFAIVIFYFLMKIEGAIYTFSVGRNVIIKEGDGTSFFLDSILSSIGFVLPSILGYYYLYIRKKSLWFPIIFSIPIFLILFLGGTRFPLLFSLLGFFIVVQAKYFKKVSVKQYVIIGLVTLGLGFGATMMKHLRSSSTKDTEFVLFDKNSEKSNLPTMLAASIMSPEGIVDMTELMFKHFEYKDHSYGKSSSFLLYFWIPRQVWPDKPTMLGHWFIREYRGGFSAGHSASFGFTGDLYADFGLFSLVFVFFLGRLLKYAENYKNVTFAIGGYEIILGAMLYPYVFFFVRSPITATMTYLGILFFFYFFKKIIFREDKIINFN